MMTMWKRHTVVLSFILMVLFTVVMFSQVSMFAQAAGSEGGAEGSAAASESPFPEGDPEAIEAGQALFTGELGCYGCDGQEGGGGMGPALNDNEWIYGGEASDIHESIAHGRPNGMPPFAEAATDEQIWQVVAFVQSLSQPE